MIETTNKNIRETYTSLTRKISDLGGDCINGRLLDDTYFMENYEIKAIGLRKQQQLNVFSKAIQQHILLNIHGVARANMSFLVFY